MTLNELAGHKESRPRGTALFDSYSFDAQRNLTVACSSSNPQSNRPQA